LPDQIFGMTLFQVLETAACRTRGFRARAWVIGKLHHADPKKIPSLEKFTGKEKPTVKPVGGDAEGDMWFRLLASRAPKDEA
jgi:hypothetical protein